MGRKLIEYLPSARKQIKEMLMIMDVAEQPEIDMLWDTLKDIMSDQFVADLTEIGILRWEKILVITPGQYESLEERRFRIFARLNESLPYTIQRLKEMLALLCGENGYNVTLYNEEYVIVVKVLTDDKIKLEDVRLLLRRVIPANLIIYLYDKYNPHSYVSLFSHEDLSRYTHDEIRTKELKHTIYNTYGKLENAIYKELENYTYEELENSEINAKE